MTQEIDAEQLIRNIEEYGDANGPDEPQAEPKETEQAAETPAEGQQEAPKELVFKTMDDLLKHQLSYKSDKKEIQEDLATILKRASQGYHYAQRMAEVNALKGEWEPKVQEAEQLREKYGKFEEYAKQNPQWFEHWTKAWEQRENPVNQYNQAEGLDTEGDANFDQRLQAALEAKLKPFQEFMSAFESKQQQEAMQQKLAEEDRVLDQQINEVRKKYDDIDFDYVDPESGKSLEWQVMEFGAQNGIPNFEHAFRVLYHDELVKRELDRSNEAATKQQQEMARNGILDVKSQPSTQKTPNLKGKSWEQLTQMAAATFGIKS